MCFLPGEQRRGVFKLRSYSGEVLVRSFYRNGGCFNQPHKKCTERRQMNANVCENRGCTRVNRFILRNGWGKFPRTLRGFCRLDDPGIANAGSTVRFEGDPSVHGVVTIAFRFPGYELKMNTLCARRILHLHKEGTCSHRAQDQVLGTGFNFHGFPMVRCRSYFFRLSLVRMQ